MDVTQCLNFFFCVYNGEIKRIEFWSEGDITVLHVLI